MIRDISGATKSVSAVEYVRANKPDNKKVNWSLWEISTATLCGVAAIITLINAPVPTAIAMMAVTGTALRLRKIQSADDEPENESLDRLISEAVDRGHLEDVMLLLGQAEDTKGLDSPMALT